MNRRVQTLLSILLVASAAMLGGCVAGTSEDESSEQALDELIGRDTDTSSDSTETTDQPATTKVETPTFVVRDAPAQDTSYWAWGEPRPIPWHQNETAATGSNGTASAADDADSPPMPPVVKTPSNAR